MAVGWVESLFPFLLLGNSSIMSHCSRLFLIICIAYLSLTSDRAAATVRSKTDLATDRPTSEQITPFYLQAQAQSPTPQPSVSPSAANSNSIPWKEWAWWGAIALLPIGVIGGILFSLRRTTVPKKSRRKLLARPSGGTASQNNRSDYNSTLSPEATEQTQESTFSKTTRLSKVDIIGELITDLQSPDPSRRRKAVWELGQRGDSRAIQPLVDLLVDSDSNQRSLILAAISEISIRTLKPMNRALMMSLQDDSSDVRKNAIRDVTRIYDLIAQISQLLHYATSDADNEVRDTAQWALTQLNRIRPSEEVPNPVNGVNSNTTHFPHPPRSQFSPENVEPENEE
ncbi:MAG: hypothetical protein HC769_21995 [Cyanobacteria bacterium CRU_2_1]|nr:hypothetical protein [Cyanobacteria bacterium RU_5_0]NJR61265.1 hypothetical protein [Cyanobacteria bacterium CRU_2_1]